jgi:hypothetical protein
MRPRPDRLAGVGVSGSVEEMCHGAQAHLRTASISTTSARAPGS